WIRRDKPDVHKQKSVLKGAISMAIENAKKFLEQVMKDEALRKRAVEKEPAEVVEIAKKLGFDVTAEELDEAVKEMRQKAKEKLKELGPGDLDNVAGGVWWLSEDAPDGHEFACMLTYHNAAYQYENGYWCKEEHYCNQNHVWYI
ncbi:MAG: Nif11-like leader peptide family RiPP precursor, partial [Clostridia bacterium]|nr:Nif11-like leader peptide family RiPP precursor [Clostridia bacterium]